MGRPPAESRPGVSEMCAGLCEMYAGPPAGGVGCSTAMVGLPPPWGRGSQLGGPQGRVESGMGDPRGRF